MMLLLAVIPLLISILLYSRQILIYQKTIGNIKEANMIALKVDQTVLERMWDLISGQATIEAFTEKNILEELRNDIRQIQSNTNTAKEASTLDVALRTIDTLEDYQNELITNIRAEDSIEKNEQIINEVDAVTQLLSAILQDFVRVEIDLASKKSSELIRSLVILTFMDLFLLSSIFFLAQKNRRFMEEHVQKPVNRLITMAEALSSGNLGFRLELPEAKELRVLTISMNKMADELNESLQENALKQYYLAQSEVRVLQAQITPHFIYNSLDAIVSLIEQKRFEESLQMTYALSDFFRTSLSKGQDWITIEKEKQHIQDYLTILQIRYGKMLDYTISIPDELLQEKILKMILQPLIENAIYHGTKFVRRAGHIQVTAKANEQKIQFQVIDNGIGIKPERLAEIREELSRGIESDFSVGYGLYNVNKRLLLYYGESQQEKVPARITIESIYRKGTVVTLTVPRRFKN